MEQTQQQKKRKRTFTTLEAKMDENGVQYFKLKKFAVIFFVVLMVMLVTIFALTIASFYITQVPSSSKGALYDRSGNLILSRGYSRTGEVKRGDGKKRADDLTVGLLVCNDEMAGATFTVYGELDLAVPVAISGTFSATSISSSTLQIPKTKREVGKNGVEKQIITTTTAPLMSLLFTEDRAAAVYLASTTPIEARDVSYVSGVEQGIATYLYGFPKLQDDLSKAQVPYPYTTSLNNSNPNMVSVCSQWSNVKGIRVAARKEVLGANQTGLNDVVYFYAGAELDVNEMSAIAPEVDFFVFPTLLTRQFSTWNSLRQLWLSMRVDSV